MGDLDHHVPGQHLGIVERVRKLVDRRRGNARLLQDVEPVLAALGFEMSLHSPVDEIPVGEAARL